MKKAKYSCAQGINFFFFSIVFRAVQEKLKQQILKINASSNREGGEKDKKKYQYPDLSQAKSNDVVYFLRLSFPEDVGIRFSAAPLQV